MTTAGVFYLYPTQHVFERSIELEIHQRVTNTVSHLSRYGFTYKDIRDATSVYLSKTAIVVVLHSLVLANWLAGSEDKGWTFPHGRDLPTTFEHAASTDDFVEWIASRREVS